jgi:NADH-quinone oxidoreductase subunit F
MTVERVLDAEPLASLDDYVGRGGGEGLHAATRLGPEGVIDDVEASGLRGRGGAGFLTGRKWRTVLESLSPALPATVVVNAAEGEPGTFKDRTIMRRNPYRVLEGALVAASAVGADAVIVALNASFHQEIERIGKAIEEVRTAGWTDEVELFMVEGPSHYLYGEESALLEVIAGRNPFPRVAPPFRSGVDELDPSTKSAAGEALAGPDTAPVPPTLVNNVETLANVPAIVAQGADWFRTLGTRQSPGTVACTISGAPRRHGVGEFPLGTPLGEVIEAVGGGPRRKRRLVAAMSGVANPLIPAEQFDTPLSYEAMEEIGSGVGAAGFIVFDDETDPVAVAHGVSRFLAVESCGQCTPCKQDGLTMATLFHRLRTGDAGERELAQIEDHVRTVADEARCFLAHQHQRVAESILRLFPEQVRSHLDGRAPESAPELIAPIVDIVDGRAVLDERHADKQPDWTFDSVYSGQSPADRVQTADQLL